MCPTWNSPVARQHDCHPVESLTHSGKLDSTQTSRPRWVMWDRCSAVSWLWYLQLNDNCGYHLRISIFIQSVPTSLWLMFYPISVLAQKSDRLYFVRAGELCKPRDFHLTVNSVLDDSKYCFTLLWNLLGSLNSLSLINDNFFSLKPLMSYYYVFLTKRPRPFCRQTCLRVRSWVTAWRRSAATSPWRWKWMAGGW